MCLLAANGRRQSPLCESCKKRNGRHMAENNDKNISARKLKRQ